jgi:anti-sigma factor RsiW
MTPCPDREPMLQALLDGELDAANALVVEAHLKTCAACAGHFAALQAVHERLGASGLTERAPAHLHGRITQMLDREARQTSPAPASARRPWWTGLAAAWSVAGAMTAVAAGLAVGPMLEAPAVLADQLVASHVRSLQPGHLIDVATSDRHVVRPWFNGRIDYAPPVPDLAAQGFPLVGGRLDYADGRTVAALVYRRRAHVINLFVLPARNEGVRLPRLGAQAPPGYSVVHWRGGGLDYWAVSDVEGGELAGFREAFQAATAR